ncbi:MAG: YbhB/YbcL family Raf kinase inhibitor-like protein [Chloroflexi bacterium]|nr:YbhB/YbcL family Raf kinase inhibitor-like protein [Chloroflexota bacterium]
MTLTSTAFAEGEAIPEAYRSGPIFGCDGEDLSPPFSWNGVPAGTQSLALIMTDDFFEPPFVHWAIFNILASTGLAEGVPHEATLPDGSLQGEIFPGSGEIGYFGPCPPPGETHPYRFTLYALDITLDLEAGTFNEDVLAALEQAAAEGHVLGQGELTATYTG